MARDGGDDWVEDRFYYYKLSVYSLMIIATTTTTTTVLVPTRAFHKSRLIINLMKD